MTARLADHLYFLHCAPRAYTYQGRIRTFWPSPEGAAPTPLTENVAAPREAAV
jgi:hypothetical protein